MKRKIAAAVTALTMLLVTRASIAAEYNLVTNGDFDTDLNGWELDFSRGSTDWSSDDSDGDPESGSAFIYAPPRSSVRLRSGCIPVVGGSSYVTSAALLRSVQGIDTYFNRVFFGLTWAQGSACESPLVQQTLPLPALSASWKTVSNIVAAPADATSVSVFFGVMVGSVPQLEAAALPSVTFALTAQFDKLYFAPACDGACGDVVTYESLDGRRAVAAELVTSSDALHILRGAIGEEACPACICDVNSSGDVSATDALLALAAATGEPVSLICPE